jgi:hypothetical protein
MYVRKQSSRRGNTASNTIQLSKNSFVQVTLNPKHIEQSDNNNDTSHIPAYFSNGNWYLIFQFLAAKDYLKLRLQSKRHNSTVNHYFIITHQSQVKELETQINKLENTMLKFSPQSQQIIKQALDYKDKLKQYCTNIYKYEVLNPPIKFDFKFELAMSIILAFKGLTRTDFHEKNVRFFNEFGNDPSGALLKCDYSRLHDRDLHNFEELLTNIKNLPDSVCKATSGTVSKLFAWAATAISYCRIEKSLSQDLKKFIDTSGMKHLTTKNKLWILKKVMSKFSHSY